MTFIEALKILGIEEYADRIINSNSRGELFHLEQYYKLAKIFPDNKEWFSPMFKDIIKHAEDTWKRPESVFQHIITILLDTIQYD